MNIDNLNHFILESSRATYASGDESIKENKLMVLRPLNTKTEIFCTMIIILVESRTEAEKWFFGKINQCG